jgi:hypothetical protein
LSMPREKWYFSQETPGFHIWKLGLDDRLLFSINSEEACPVDGLTSEGTLQQGLLPTAIWMGILFSLADGTVFLRTEGKTNGSGSPGVKQRECLWVWSTPDCKSRGANPMASGVRKISDILLLFSPDIH